MNQSFPGKLQEFEAFIQCSLAYLLGLITIFFSKLFQGWLSETHPNRQEMVPLSTSTCNKVNGSVYSP